MDEQSSDYVIDVEALGLVDPVLDLPDRVLMFEGYALRPNLRLSARWQIVCQQSLAQVEGALAQHAAAPDTGAIPPSAGDPIGRKANGAVKGNVAIRRQGPCKTGVMEGAGDEVADRSETASPQAQGPASRHDLHFQIRHVAPITTDSDGKLGHT